MDKEKLKKVVGAGTGGVGIVGIFFMLHGDIKAEIRNTLKDLEKTVQRVTVLETQEKERDRRFIQSMERIDKKLDRIDNKIDRLVR